MVDEGLGIRISGRELLNKLVQEMVGKSKWPCGTWML